MKNIEKILLLALSVALYSCSPNLTAGNNKVVHERAKVSVHGTAVQEVEPDITRWRVSLRSEGKDSEQLAKQHAQRLSQLLEFLDSEQVVKDSIQTEHMRLTENWNYHEGKRFREGFVATSSLHFKSRIDEYTALWTGLSGFKGLSVNGTYFELSNRLELEKAVRKQALLEARNKAADMAEVLGVSVGKPLYIEDLNWNDDIRMPQAEMSMLRSANKSADIVAPGKLEIRMRVKVEFEIK